MYGKRDTEQIQCAVTEHSPNEPTRSRISRAGRASRPLQPTEAISGQLCIARNYKTKPTRSRRIARRDQQAYRRTKRTHFLQAERTHGDHGYVAPNGLLSRFDQTKPFRSALYRAKLQNKANPVPQDRQTRPAGIPPDQTNPFPSGRTNPRGSRICRAGRASQPLRPNEAISGQIFIARNYKTKPIRSRTIARRGQQSSRRTKRTYFLQAERAHGDHG